MSIPLFELHRQLHIVPRQRSKAVRQNWESVVGAGPLHERLKRIFQLQEVPHVRRDYDRIPRAFLTHLTIHPGRTNEVWHQVLGSS